MYLSIKINLFLTLKNIKENFHNLESILRIYENNSAMFGKIILLSAHKHILKFSAMNSKR